LFRSQGAGVVGEVRHGRRSPLAGADPLGMMARRAWDGRRRRPIVAEVIARQQQVVVAVIAAAIELALGTDEQTAAGANLLAVEQVCRRAARFVPDHPYRLPVAARRELVGDAQAVGRALVVDRLI